MIFDRLNNAEQYFCLGKNIKRGFDFLLNSDLEKLEDGKYEICGEDIFANVQSLKTKPIEEQKWEVHRKYIDIQFVIKGKEKMGYGILADFNTNIVPYDDEKDVEFLDGKNFNYVNVRQGDFVIFYPNDVHAPMLAYDDCEDIKKVIVKIKI